MRDTENPHNTNPAWTEINLEHIAFNMHAIRKGLPKRCKFMAILKADAYGHGLLPVAYRLVRAGADMLGVGKLDEAIRLRSGGIRTPILVLVPIQTSQAYVAAAHDISVTVCQASLMPEMKARNRSGKPLRVHIKLDTGMGRIGIREQSEVDALAAHLKADDVIVEGVYTHLSTANQADFSYVHHQQLRFAQMRDWLKRAGISPNMVHSANSAAALQHPGYAQDMVRVGASLFGIHTCDTGWREALGITLRPALSWHTRILQVKRVANGSFIGYDRSYAASADEWIATVPVGYADGYFRGYSGMHVLVNGRRAPVVGNICMNQFMVRIESYVPVGTKVTLIGMQGDESVTLDDLAERIGSIPQQIVTMIPDSMPKMYVNEESVEHEQTSARASDTG